MCEICLIHWQAAPNFSYLLLAKRKQVLEPMVQDHEDRRCEFRTCSLSREFFFFLSEPHSVQDTSSPTRD